MTTCVDSENKLRSILDRATDKAKALEIAMRIFTAMASNDEPFMKRLDECLKSKDKEQLLKLIYEG